MFPDSYEEEFKKADLTFLHQRVWDPVNKVVIPLTPLPPNLDCDFIGPPIDQESGHLIAEGSFSFWIILF